LEPRVLYRKSFLEAFSDFYSPILLTYTTVNGHTDWMENELVCECHFSGSIPRLLNSTPDLPADCSVPGFPWPTSGIPFTVGVNH
jgi:hypothetical protein